MTDRTYVDPSTVRRRVLGPNEIVPSDDFYLNKSSGVDARLPLNKTALREAERKFKGKDWRINVTNEAVDFETPLSSAFKRAVKIGDIDCMYSNWLENVPVYEIEGIPGFKIIPGALCPRSQMYWLKRSLKTFMKPPNVNNLDALYTGLPEDGLFNCQEEHVTLKKKDSATVVKLDRLELMRKIRWTTLGYQYDWTSKEYDFKMNPVPFPSDLYEFSRVLAESLEFGSDYRAEAGIVNYYQNGDTLTSHVDRSELNMDAPLLSISLGSSCVFLIGGENRDDSVTPVILRSGDISVLSGPSRAYFHGVPKIIPGSLPEHLYPFEPIRNARININIRQVTL